MVPESPPQERTLWGFNAPFWVLVLGSFINSTGSALVFPFIALYIGRRFNATKAEIGLIFTYYAVVALFSGAAGGALSDRFGRKTVMVIGLGAAIVFSLSLAFAESVPVILIAILITGLFSPITWAWSSARCWAGCWPMSTTASFTSSWEMPPPARSSPW
jgi:MFS family permease